MNKIYYITILFLSISIYSFGQEKKYSQISGIVKTTDGYPAGFITVTLKNTTFGTVTDANGEFNFTAPAGEYTMVVYSIAAHRKEFLVTIKANEKNRFPDIVIIENKTQLGEVVVTGQFSPQSIRSSVYKVRVINRLQIEQKAATSLQSLLNTEVGIRMSNDMALGETDFELMGMSGNNVKVLIDGVPIIDRLSKKQSLSQIDINTVERIEIVEGPMSVIYGSDALAGVINIITKKGSKEDSRLQIGARLQEESVGSEYDFFTDKGSHNQNVNATYLFRNGISVGGSFTNNSYGGWQGDSIGRKKQWQPKDQYLIGGQLGYQNKDLNIWYRLDYLNEDILTEANINPIINRTSDKKFMVDRFTHQLQANWMPSNRLNFSVAASYQDYQRETQTIIIDLNTGNKWLSDETSSQDVVNYSSFFSRVAAVWKLTSNLSLQPGLEFQSYTGNGDRVEEGHHINNGAFFLSAEYKPLEWLNIRPGLRSNYNSAFDAPAVVPALNVKIALQSDLDLRLSYGRGYRAPSLQELYHSFHDTNHDIDGNPDLKAEYSNSYMASYVWRILHNSDVRLTSTLTGFFNDYKNRITLTQSLVQSGYFTYYNMDRYKTTGGTFENNLVWKNLSINASFSYIGRYNKYYKDETFGNTEQFRFSPELSANLIYNFPKIAMFSLFYKFTGKRHEYMTDGNNNLVLSGIESFNWADFTVSRSIGKGLTASAGIKNLFNITSVKNTASSGGAHSGTTGFSQMGCGRSYFVGLAFDFNK